MCVSIIYCLNHNDIFDLKIESNVRVEISLTTSISWTISFLDLGDVPNALYYVCECWSVLGVLLHPVQLAAVLVLSQGARVSQCIN